MYNLDFIERNHTFAEPVEDDDFDTISLGSNTTEGLWAIEYDLVHFYYYFSDRTLRHTI